MSRKLLDGTYDISVRIGGNGMRINSNIPKTFSIYAEIGGKSGYVRLVSSQDRETGGFYYNMTLVKSKRNSSKYVNFDSVKRIAQEYKEKYGFSEVKVLDDVQGKFYNVKSNEKKQNGEKKP